MLQRLLDFLEKIFQSNVLLLFQNIHRLYNVPVVGIDIEKRFLYDWIHVSIIGKEILSADVQRVRTGLIRLS